MGMEIQKGERGGGGLTGVGGVGGLFCKQERRVDKGVGGMLVHVQQVVSFLKIQGGERCSSKFGQVASKSQSVVSVVIGSEWSGTGMVKSQLLLPGNRECRSTPTPWTTLRSLAE